MSPSTTAAMAYRGAITRMQDLHIRFPIVTKETEFLLHFGITFLDDSMHKKIPKLAEYQAPIFSKIPCGNIAMKYVPRTFNCNSFAAIRKIALMKPLRITKNIGRNRNGIRPDAILSTTARTLWLKKPIAFLRSYDSHW